MTISNTSKTTPTNSARKTTETEESFFEDSVQAAAKQREEWPHSASSSVVASMAAVGLINFFYFPHSVHVHKGLAFVIPSIIFYSIVAVPMIYMEMFLGQYCGGTVIEVFRDMVPIFRGLGWFIVITTLYATLPYVSKFGELVQQLYECSGGSCFFEINNFTGNSTQTAVVFHQINHDASSTVIPLVATGTTLALYLGCTIVLAFKLKYSAYVYYVMAPLATVSFLVPFIRCLTLPGAKTGLALLMHTDLKHLLSIPVWSQTAVLGLASLNIGFGFFQSIGSKNRFNLSLTKPICVTFLVDIWVAFLGCIFLFSISGNFMHGVQEMYGIDDCDQLDKILLSTSPQNLILSMLSTNAFSKIYPICFIVSLAILVFTTILLSMYPLIEFICLNAKISILQKRPVCSILVNGFMAAGSVALVIPALKGIQAVMYSTIEANLWSMFLQTVVVGWIYGKYRFREKIAHSQLIENLPNSLLYIFIQYLVPVVMIASIVTTAINFRNPPDISDGLVIFKGAVLVGFALFLLIIPAIVELIKQKLDLKATFSPAGIWAPLPEDNVTVALLATMDKKNKNNAFKHCC